MAFWGMDIAQNDGFCKIYDEYMDMYDAGGDPADISAQILLKYGSGKGGEEHNAYFAVAKAEHALCSQSHEVLEKVCRIIMRGADADYYRTLGFSEGEVSEREKYLAKFLGELAKTREKARKRKISSYNSIKRLPKGEIGCYAADGGFYGFVVLDAVYEGRLLAITEKLGEAPKNEAEILNSPVLTVI
jgi:hypothetical protein